MAASEPAGRPVARGEGDPFKSYVRILGTRLGRYVEFEYSLGDGCLAIELILPLTAFDEFCATRQAVILTPDSKIAQDLEQLAWRAGQPGLLRRPTVPRDADT